MIIKNTEILLGDNVTVLKTLPADLVDMTFTSPPYGHARDYDGKPDYNLTALAQELYRVTKFGGMVVWNTNHQTIDGDETCGAFHEALRFRKIGFKLHDTMIYARNVAKPIKLNRYAAIFEYIFCFVKGKLKTFNPIQTPTKSAGKVKTFTVRRPDGSVMPGIPKPTPKTRNVGNIFYYGQCVNTTGHPAIFPIQFARDMIYSWSNPNDTILDPFCGSGTTLAAAKEMGRLSFGIEISEEYRMLARKRIDETIPNSVSYDPIKCKWIIQGKEKD